MGLVTSLMVSNQTEGAGWALPTPLVSPPTHFLAHRDWLMSLIPNSPNKMAKASQLIPARTCIKKKDQATEPENTHHLRAQACSWAILQEHTSPRPLKVGIGLLMVHKIPMQDSNPAICTL